MKNMAVYAGFAAVALGLAGCACVCGDKGSAVKEAAAETPARKHILGYGWEFLAVSTEDVYRNREKLNDAGFAGYLIAMDRTGKDGKLVRARDVLASPAWKDSDFDRSVGYMQKCLSEPGFRESMAFAFLIPAKRLDWTDDAAWAQAANNMAVLARAAKRAGFRGVCLDQEDYTRQKQFLHADTDPEYFATCELARRRGREMFSALFENFPEARLMAFWLFTQWRSVVIAPDVAAANVAKRDLWPAFLNGMLDVIPPTAKFIDGNETTGYRTHGGPQVWRGAAYETVRSVRPLIAPENRAKYESGISVGFGQYIDSYIAKEGTNWYLPPVGGSRTRGFAANLSDAASIADEYIWVYGEHGTIIDWDRKNDKRLQYPTWESLLPGFHRMVKVVAGGIDGAKKIIADEKLPNLYKNFDCDSKDGKVPPEYSTWTKLKDPDKDMFGWDDKVGCSKPGSLRLYGDGCYTASLKDLKPGSILYLRARVKGAKAPSATVGWKRNGNWDWKLPTVYLNAKVGADQVEWCEIESLVSVPENANGLGFTLGEKASKDAPVYFDDYEAYLVFE